MVNVGGIVSVGGGPGGGGGSGSGIQFIGPGGNDGPTVQLEGVNGIDITGGGNVVVIDGASLSGLIAAASSSSGVDCYTSSFTATVSGQFAHNLGTRDLLVQVIDNSQPPIQLFPDSIIYDTLDTFSVLFNQPQSGRVVAIACAADVSSAAFHNRVELDLEFKRAFNFNTYSEITRVSGQITQIDIWETMTKADKLFTKALTRVSGQISQVTLTCEQRLSTLVTDITRDFSGVITAITKTYTP